MQLASMIALASLAGVLQAGEAVPTVIPPVAPAPTAVEPADPGDTPVPVVTPVVLSVNARGGGSWSPNDKDPSRLFGGVDLAYEGAEVACDRLAYWQSPLSGAKRSFLDHARIDSGPDGRDPDHVIFDSRKATLPQFGFRGLMTPVSVEVVRQPSEPLPAQKPVPVPAPTPAPAVASPATGAPAAPHPTALAPFHVQLHQLGDFSGELQTASGWAPYVGWADEADLVLVGDVVESGIAQPRFRSLVLTGRAARDGQPRKRAKLQRLKQPVADAAAIKALKADAIDWAIESLTITVTFTADGRLDRVTGGIDTLIIGTPGLDTPVEAPEAGKPGPEAGKPGK
jgi:hypothetical protein